MTLYWCLPTELLTNMSDVLPTQPLVPEREIPLPWAGSVWFIHETLTRDVQEGLAKI